MGICSPHPLSFWSITPVLVQSKQKVLETSQWLIIPHMELNEGGETRR